MKINWKARFKHGPFLTALFSLVLILVQQIASLFGFDTTIYNEQITLIFNTILGIAVLIGVVSDPTTNGVNDSKRALNYDEPHKD